MRCDTHSSCRGGSASRVSSHRSARRDLTPPDLQARAFVSPCLLGGPCDVSWITPRRSSTISFVPLRTLPSRRADAGGRDRPQEPLSELSVESTRRRDTRRPRGGVRLADGADRHHRSRCRRVGARPSMQRVRRRPTQPSGGRRQPVVIVATGGDAVGAAAVPARVDRPAVNVAAPALADRAVRRGSTLATSHVCSLADHSVD